VHEAYLQLASIRELDWKARGQFIAVMAQMMRRILVDHARSRNAMKRDAARLMTVAAGEGAEPLDVLFVDQALGRMSSSYPRHAQIVQMRFFGGLESPEIAEVLDVSLSTVERDWRFARAWLQKQLSSQ
jgi:RNA polymerase sigma-70 factor (ECF subfamily)